MRGELQTCQPTGGGRYLVVLLGSLEFDGRVQRMVEVLAELGEVMVVDVAAGGQAAPVTQAGVERYTVAMPAGLGCVRRHLRLGWAALQAARRLRPDWVVAEDYLTAPAGWLAAMVARAGLIYDAHELIVPEAGRRQSIRARFWYWLERWTVRRAALVIAANEERAEVMADHYGVGGITYMRNIPRPAVEAEIQASEVAWPALRRRGPEDRLIVYQGYLSLARGLDRFIAALEFLPEEYRLILAGGGPDEGAIRVLVERLGLTKRVTLLGRIANRALAGVSRACDVGIVCYSFAGLNNRYCAPNKVFEYARAGLPVVATGQPGLRRLVTGYEIGEVVVEPDGPESVAGTVARVAERGKEGYRENLQRFTAAHRWEGEAERVRAAIRGI